MKLKGKYLVQFADSFSNCNLRNKETIILSLKTYNLSYLCIPKIHRRNISTSQEMERWKHGPNRPFYALLEPFLPYLVSEFKQIQKQGIRTVY